MVCVTDVYSREMIHMFLVGQASGLFKNFNIGIFSDTINVINVKLCMGVLLIKLYPFIPLDQSFGSQQYWTVLIEKFIFMFSKLKLCRIVK